MPARSPACRGTTRNGRGPLPPRGFLAALIHTPETCLQVSSTPKIRNQKAETQAGLDSRSRRSPPPACQPARPPAGGHTKRPGASAAARPGPACHRRGLDPPHPHRGCRVAGPA
ncbi:unnamed protein product [Urochloa humidicola]